MNLRWKYFKWVLRHKRFVFEEGLRLGTPYGGPLRSLRWWWQLARHDLSKFSRAEFGPYMRHFDQKDAEQPGEFDRAWLHHIHRNPHHWDYYVLRVNTEVTALKVPERFLREMAADWLALARGRKNPPTKWYKKARATIHMHPESRARIESLIGFTPPVPPVVTVATVRTTPKL